MENLSLKILEYLDKFISINIECYNFEPRNNNVRIYFRDKAFMQHSFMNSCNIFIRNINKNLPIKKVRCEKKNQTHDENNDLINAEMIITFYY